MKIGEIKYKIYVDLDGVLADFVKGVQGLIDGYDDEVYSSSAKYRKEMWAAVNKYRKEGGQLWAELDTMPDAYELWDYVKHYNPEILTATGNPEYGSGEQKLEWFPTNFDTNTKINLVRKSADKAQFAAANHILIDDMTKSINPWKAAGGIGILHTSAKDTIKQLKELGL